jgi:sorbitol-specific phosphotransferase system component IIBC
MEKIFKDIGKSVVVTASIILIIPFSAFMAYLTGLVMKMFCGQLICDGMNLLFGTTRFTPELVPKMFVALGIITSWLKTRVSIDKN